jgi:hypothetical protein
MVSDHHSHTMKMVLGHYFIGKWWEFTTWTHWKWWSNTMTHKWWVTTILRMDFMVLRNHSLEMVNAHQIWYEDGIPSPSTLIKMVCWHHCDFANTLGAQNHSQFPLKNIWNSFKVIYGYALRTCKHFLVHQFVVSMCCFEYHTSVSLPVLIHIRHSKAICITITPTNNFKTHQITQDKSQDSLALSLTWIKILSRWRWPYRRW